MGNYIPVGTLGSRTMAARSPRFGIDHPTIVPTNAADEATNGAGEPSATDRTGEDDESEPRSA